MTALLIQHCEPYCSVLQKKRKEMIFNCCVSYRELRLLFSSMSCQSMKGIGVSSLRFLGEC